MMPTKHTKPVILGKHELVHQVAARSEVSLHDASRIIDALTEVIHDELSEGHEVRLMGFGTWSLRPIAQRKVKDIRTGNWKTIPATKRVGFKVGAVLAQSAQRALRRERRRR
jgi:DNA-binding protein HU-beta